MNTTASAMDADNTRNIAHRRLGRILELRGEWQAALAKCEQWHPSSWCANEAIEFDYEREAGLVPSALVWSSRSWSLPIFATERVRFQLGATPPGGHCRLIPKCDR